MSTTQSSNRTHRKPINTYCDFYSVSVLCLHRQDEQCTRSKHLKSFINSYVGYEHSWIYFIIFGCVEIFYYEYVCMNGVNCALPFNYIGNAINIRLRRLSFSTSQHRFKLKLMSLSLGLVPCHSLIWKKMHTYLNSAKNILIMKILCLFFCHFTYLPK